MSIDKILSILDAKTSYEALLQELRGRTKWPALEKATKDDINLYAVQAVLAFAQSKNPRFASTKLQTVAQLRKRLQDTLRDKLLTAAQAKSLELLLKSADEPNKSIRGNDDESELNIIVAMANKISISMPQLSNKDKVIHRSSEALT